MVKIVADENMPLVEELFGPSADQLVLKAGRTLAASDVADADVLLVRSVTPVNQALLAGSKVTFVGSATIGVDHIDQAWLAEQGIEFHHSPGCNAESVVDYVLAALEYFGAQQQLDWCQLTVGVIGCGNVGGRLVKRLNDMGVRVLKNDPPREQSGESGYTELDTLLSQSDIVCCHTPLVKDGPWPSYHLINERNLGRIKSGALLLNAGRGPVISEQALLNRLRQQADLHLVLDVWETEPQVNQELLAHCLIGTPHIAGYSLDGRIRGTWMLYQRFSEWLDRPGIPEPMAEQNLPEPIQLPDDLTGVAMRQTLVKRLYDIKQDDQRMRVMLKGLRDTEAAEAFDRLRKEYPVRREFSCLNVAAIDEQQRQTAQAMGFSVQSSD